MPAQPSTLFIPVENQVRELDAKLLLGALAASRGFPVIIGSRAFVHYRIASLPRGIYLAKSMRSLSVRMFRILRRLGHEIVAWDEEGLIRLPDEHYYRQRLSATAFRQISHLFAWGPDNERVLRSFPHYHGAPIHVTGNPRVDLLRPELLEYYRPEAEAIRERYGDFVLVNTNFGTINHYFPDLGTYRGAVEGRGPLSDDPFMVARARDKLQIFESFREMVPALCEAIPERTVVLRPHPSESHAPWQAIAARHPNLRVVNEGSVVPWLIAARVLVANGCTTAVEAAILGTPTISYEPVKSLVFEDPLPPAASSYRISAIDELRETVRAVMAGELGIPNDPVREAALRQHIAALDGPLAIERVVGALEEAGYAERQPPRSHAGDFWRGWLETRTRNAKKYVNMYRPGHRNNRRYHAHRFPGLSVANLEQQICRFDALLGQRFGKLRVEPVSRHVFRITRAGVSPSQ